MQLMKLFFLFRKESYTITELNFIIKISPCHNSKDFNYDGGVHGVLFFRSS